MLQGGYSAAQDYSGEVDHAQGCGDYDLSVDYGFIQSENESESQRTSDHAWVSYEEELF